jgi:hypothetical protein
MTSHRVVVVAAVLLIAATGCAADRSASSASSKGNPVTMPTVTVPNGSSPAKANAPHAPMNDASRDGWNHGNGDLWVNLPPEGTHPPGRCVGGEGRVVPGEVAVVACAAGAVLDRRSAAGRAGAAAALRGRDGRQYGAFGPVANIIFFPTDGFWEVTGHLDDKTLTFVVQLVK